MPADDDNFTNKKLLFLHVIWKFVNVFTWEILNNVNFYEFIVFEFYRVKNPDYQIF